MERFISRRLRAILSPALGVVATAAVLGLAIHWSAPSDLSAGFRSRVGHLVFESPQVTPLALSLDGDRLFAVHTPRNSLAVIDLEREVVIDEIPVGLEPVSVALRPDGKVLYVVNHLSDSVSVVDPVARAVIATIQDVEPRTRDHVPNPMAGFSHLDEPVGVAFTPDSSRAFVCLSESNRVTIIDSREHRLLRTIDLDRFDIGINEPRSLAVSPDGSTLYVPAFESGNRTETMLEEGRIPPVPEGQACSEGEIQALRSYIFAAENVFEIKGNIVRHDGSNEFPAVPDRDLAVIDVASGTVREVVSDVGTLLYGIAVSPDGRTVYVTTTEAQNDRNGFAALQSRPFRNQLAVIERDPLTGRHHVARRADLDSPGEVPPTPEVAAATPYGIAVSPDGRLLYVTAAASDRILVTTPDGDVIARILVGENPRGVVVSPDGDTVFVHNRASSTVTVIDVSTASAVNEIGIGVDPTPIPIRNGRRVVNSAAIASNGSFACASCHPDGGTDQLSWDQGPYDEHGRPVVGPRATMLLRGLRGTQNFHWDGIFPTLRDLVVGTITGPVMASTVSDSDAADGSAFLESIVVPPGPTRLPDDRLSPSGQTGMELFLGTGCASAPCHAAPFWQSNTVVAGIETVSMRGLFDRNQVLHDGVNSNMNVVRCFGADRGRVDARGALRSFFSVFFASLTSEQHDLFDNLFREFGTGLAGALGRQVTVDSSNIGREDTRFLFRLPWQAARARKVVLVADGVDDGSRVHYEYDSTLDRFVGPARSATLRELGLRIASGHGALTFTAMPGETAGVMPELRSATAPAPTTRDGEIPRLPIGQSIEVTLSGANFASDARLLVNGRPSDFALNRVSSTTLTVTVFLGAGEHPATWGIAVQNPDGGQSNELMLKFQRSNDRL